MPFFGELERSRDRGMPVTLYRFWLGVESWNYCSGESTVRFGGVDFEPIPITNEGSTQSGDTSNDSIEISIPRSAAITNLFIGSPPTSEMSVVIRDWHYGAENAPVVWSGLVKSVKRTSQVLFKFTCKTLLASLDRPGLRLAYSRTCPHALYDSGCRVNPEDFALTTTVTGVGPQHINCAGLGGYANRYFSYGFVSFSGIAGVTERIGIDSHVGGRINLLGTTERLSMGQTVTLYPGCNRNIGTCINKFNNLLNFGGFPHMPNKSPFDGSPIF